MSRASFPWKQFLTFGFTDYHGGLEMGRPFFSTMLSDESHFLQLILSRTQSLALRHVILLI